MNRPLRFALLIAVAVVVASGLLAGCGDGLPGDAVAKVGDAYVSEEDFDRQVEYAAQSYGVTKVSDPDTYKQLEDIILGDLIQVEVAKQKAAELGVNVTDADVEDAVKTLVEEYFAGDQAALESQLALQEMTMDDLRSERRDSLTIQGVYDTVIEELASVPDEDIETYYSTNKGDYLTEPTINARHIFITVSDGASEEYTTSTTTTEASDSASPTDVDSSESTTTTTELSELAWAEALAVAAQVRLDLLRGGSWDELAKEYSDDDSTKDSGGDLGEVSQGLYVDEFGPEFDSALFALLLDEIPEPIRTANGYHIVQVTALNDPVQRALEEVRDEIVDVLLAQAKLAAWTDWVEKTQQEIGVTYRKDLRPTTTVIAPTTTSTSFVFPTTPANP